MVFTIVLTPTWLQCLISGVLASHWLSGPENDRHSDEQHSWDWWQRTPIAVSFPPLRYSLESDWYMKWVIDSVIECTHLAHKWIFGSKYALMDDIGGLERLQPLQRRHPICICNDTNATILHILLLLRDCIFQSNDEKMRNKSRKIMSPWVRTSLSMWNALYFYDWRLH